MGGVGGELFLLRERGGKTAEGGIERSGELAQFIVRVGDVDTLRKISGGDASGRGTDFLDRLERAASEQPDAAESQRQHGQSATDQPHREPVCGLYFRENGATGQNAIAPLGVVKGFAESAARPEIRAGVPAGLIGSRRLHWRVGRTFEQCAAAARPNREVKTVRRAFVEERRHFTGNVKNPLP